MRSHFVVALAALTLFTPVSEARFRPFGGFFARIFTGGPVFPRLAYRNGFYGGGGCGFTYAPSCGGGFPICGGGFQPRPPRPDCPNCPPPGGGEIKPPPGGEIVPPPEKIAGRSYVVIHGIPTGAKVTVDGVDFTRSGPAPEYRLFYTKVLQPGRYASNFKIEYVTPDGTQLATAERRVTYPTNHRTEINLKDIKTNYVALKAPVKPGEVFVSTPVREEATATLEWDLPDDAAIYVNGKMLDRNDEVTRIRTPELAASKEYAFDVTVTHDKNGIPTQVNRKVVFKAGDRLVLGLPITDATKLAVAHVAPREMVAVADIK